MRTRVALVFVAAGVVGAVGCSQDAGDEDVGEAGENALTASQLHCASANNRYASCTVEGRIADARLVRQVSRTRCVQDLPAPDGGVPTRGNWGFTPGESFIWVDRGCRADFEVSFSEQLDCSSQNNAPARCPTTLANITKIRVVRQHSRSSCQENRSFGFDNDSVWVDRGCRATFEVVGTRR